MSIIIFKSKIQGVLQMKEKFLLFYMNRIKSGKTGEWLYQVTTKPKKSFSIHGITFNISEWSPSQVKSDVITSGFANDISLEEFENLGKIFPEGSFYMDVNSDPSNPTIMSHSEYDYHLKHGDESKLMEEFQEHRASASDASEFA
tara:strand:+ start:12153 stop:12587 length:435 start_codon:yes stop_codon:yes gene_type:complete